MQIDYIKGGRQKNTYNTSEVIDTPCPLCAKNDYKEIYKERGALGIVLCNECDLIYVNPRLKNPEEIYWGDAEQYYKESRLVFEGKAPHHRDKNYLEDLRLIQKYKATGNFLDVGANMGFFLRNAKKWEGWNLYGVEPSPSLSDLARKYFDLNIKTAFLEEAEFESDFFDVITMTDVFEHVTNPEDLLREAGRILKKDGILFIKVPNGLFNLLKFKIAKLTGKLRDYDLFDSYEHVVHYSDKTLKQMLTNNGFTVVKTKPGSPIQLPVWHKYVGQYYQYRSPWVLDYKKHIGRRLFYLLARVECFLLGKRVGSLAPNIVVVAKKSL